MHAHESSWGRMEVESDVQKVRHLDIQSPHEGVRCSGKEFELSSTKAKLGKNEDPTLLRCQGGRYRKASDSRALGS